MGKDLIFPSKWQPCAQLYIELDSLHATSREYLNENIELLNQNESLNAVCIEVIDEIELLQE